MIRDIVTTPDPRLKEVSASITDEAEITRVAADLYETMVHLKADGLAAVQIGEMVRMFAVRDSDGEISIYIDPVIISSSGSTKTNEGCFSQPGVFKRVKRPRKIVMEAGRFDWGHVIERKTMTITGFEAVVCQHEIDHLDGILFTEKGDI